jgi:beta-xylosidase
MPLLQDIQIRDPFIIQEGGRLYLFGSTDKDIWQGGTGFDAYISTGDLREFEGPFPAFRPPEGFWSHKNFWAPEVYAYPSKGNGAYYLFATFKPDQGRRGTAILHSQSLPGPFLPWSCGPVTPADWECLDGTLHIDPQGKPWMVFCHEWQQVGDGEICLMPLSEDLRDASGEPQLLFRASEAPWTQPLKGRFPGSYVTDGPFLHRMKHGGLIMLWSSFDSAGYALGIARSKSGSVLGPWQQEEKPLFAADGGHGMLFTTQEGALYLTVHTPNITPHERAVFIEVVETNDTIKLKEAL